MSAETVEQARLQSLEWMTLRECHNDSGMSVEFLRGECVAGRLKHQPFGSEKHRTRRVHVDDWAAYKQRQRDADAERRGLAAVAKAAPTRRAERNMMGI